MPGAYGVNEPAAQNSSQRKVLRRTLRDLGLLLKEGELYARPSRNSTTSRFISGFATCMTDDILKLPDNSASETVILDPLQQRYFQYLLPNDIAQFMEMFQQTVHANQGGKPRYEAATRNIIEQYWQGWHERVEDALSKIQGEIWMSPRALAFKQSMMDEGLRISGMEDALTPRTHRYVVSSRSPESLEKLCEFVISITQEDPASTRLKYDENRVIIETTNSDLRYVLSGLKNRITPPRTSFIPR